MKKFFIILGVVIILVLVGLGVASTRDADLAETSSDRIPDIALTTHSGDDVTLTSFTGNMPLIINSWASWCPFCVVELPDFAKLGDEFGDSIRVIAINRSESEARANEFLASTDLSDTDIVFLRDKDDAFYREIGGFSMPETLFVNSDGTVQFHKRGFMELTEMRTRTQALIDSSK